MLWWWSSSGMAFGEWESRWWSVMEAAAAAAAETDSTTAPPPPQDTDHEAQAPHTNAIYPRLTEDGDLDPSVFVGMPFRFDTGIALFAKRTPRPFPPPFLSPPSGSFSDPLSTHDRSRDRRGAYVDGHRIQGYTNGDDAVFASDYFVGANDGVGAWSARPRGHAGLWARLILHFWATAMFEDAARKGTAYRPDPISYLQRAYDQTTEATGPPNDWQGTTTTAGAQLHYRRSKTATEDGQTSNETTFEPLLHVLNLGDSQVMVIRPETREMLYKSVEQWHWFDCPRQLGTNSPDTPRGCAVVDEVPLREGDVVLAMSDGVIDNLWAHEIVEKVCDSLEQWRSGEAPPSRSHQGQGASEKGEGKAMMEFVAEELMEAARVIAVDPFAESPFMEHAIEEGLASGGGEFPFRTKQYKKLMRSFEQLGFRQPYQLLITSDVLLDTTKLDLVSLFEKTLSTKGVKPMITQCCIRALYAKNTTGGGGPNRDPAVVAAIDRAKTFERRRCGHLMVEDPLTERECMLSVVDPKGKGDNKFRYVVVTQDEWLRDRLRSVVPTPLMYVRRSVMVYGIVRRPQKRKREEHDNDNDDEGAQLDDEHSGSEDDAGTTARSEQADADGKPKKKKKQYGRKQPNPLAVKKAKASAPGHDQQRPRKPPVEPQADAPAETKAKRKRRKKASSGASGGSGESNGTEQAGNGEAVAVEAAAS
ncbi:Fcf1-domain-containing protein [Dichotomopilus funicola]|uniref:Protein phosphatase n=1 Tax=Dichotomopilus funicola TaxID=1934379 RepID=A0AAN6V6Z3_9PEZI|nr:Fcf1-domain-containing protein [Dichotomopilus funicola]